MKNLLFTLFLLTGLSLSAQTAKTRSALYGDTSGLPTPITRTTLAAHINNVVASSANLTDAQTFLGQNTFNLAPIVPVTDLGTDFASGTALTLSTHYRATLASAKTLTFSGTPAEGSTVSVRINCTTAATLTIPSSKRVGQANTAITSLAVPVGMHELRWRYVGGEYMLYDTIPVQASIATDIAGLGTGVATALGNATNATGGVVTYDTVSNYQTQVPGINAQTASYTLALSDAGKVVTTNVASANTVTIPTNATVAIPINTVIKVAQLGAGVTTLVTTGITITGPTSCLGQGGSLVLTKLGTDTWLSEGPIGISVASGKTFTVNNSLTLAGTDGTTITTPGTSATMARTDAAQTFTGASTATSWNLVTPVIQGASASGASNIDLSGGTGYFRPPTGGVYFSGGQQHQLNNVATAAQAPTAATRTYITGSNLNFTAGSLRVGTILRWKFNMTKTAAGTATSTIDIAFGTAGTTSDTARVSFTKPAGTAVADEGWVTVQAVVKTASASGVVIGEFTMIHNLSATGHMTIPAACVTTTSGTFDTTTVTNVGLCLTTGASDAITIQQCTAEAINL